MVASTQVKTAPAVLTEYGVGLHYTAFRDAIREDSRQTIPSRDVTPRRKFAVEANVESRAGRQGDRPRARRTAPQVRLARVPDALNRNGRSGGPQNASELSPSVSRRVACHALNRRCRRVSSRKTDCKCPRRLGAAEARGGICNPCSGRISGDLI